MQARAASRVGFSRSARDRLVAGVAGGIAERIDVDPTVIRLAFVVLAFAGGFGVVLYLFGWLVGADPAPASATSDGSEPARPATEARKVVSIGMIVAGMLLLLREAGLWLGDAVVWSVGLAAFGSAILWTRTDESGRARFARIASRLPRSPAQAMSGRSKGRLFVGALLVIAGMATFLAANTSLSALRNVTFAILVTAVGLGLVLGPWIYDLIRQLSTERRERIRSQERSEVAAHLHDSVLQTLAMIQRAPTPQEMSALARGQERELRAWLYGRSATVSGGSETLSVAVDQMAARVERMQRVAVESVVVGEAPMDDRMRALIDATGEATVNAARHSGAAMISVYVEIEEDAARVYVRDEGAGFDPGAVAADRRGISESIAGRMERNGGTATITSAPGEGTEVRLVMPRRAS